jgi:hypothetical protein
MEVRTDVTGLGLSPFLGSLIRNITLAFSALDPLLRTGYLQEVNGFADVFTLFLRAAGAEAGGRTSGRLISATQQS